MAKRLPDVVLGPDDFEMTMKNGRPTFLKMTDAGLAKMKAAGWEFTTPCRVKSGDVPGTVVVTVDRTVS